MRIKKMREYLFNILDDLVGNKDYQLNINFIDKDNFSLDRIPVDSIVEKWITGETKLREVYDLRSSKPYSADIITNLNNIGFFEEFEDKIYSNNEQKILPDIEGIESIKCLNVGALALPRNTECNIFNTNRNTVYETKKFKFIGGNNGKSRKTSICTLV